MAGIAPISDERPMKTVRIYVDPGKRLTTSTIKIFASQVAV
jgi:hypothetical protein